MIIYNMSHNVYLFCSEIIAFKYLLQRFMVLFQDFQFLKLNNPGLLTRFFSDFFSFAQGQGCVSARKGFWENVLFDLLDAPYLLTPNVASQVLPGSIHTLIVFSLRTLCLPSGKATVVKASVASGCMPSGGPRTGPIQFYVFLCQLQGNTFHPVPSASHPVGQAALTEAMDAPG